ncbi:MAG: EamA family transporter [Armatimonadota bacterium]|jgi:drug/metabolite transporter (DMT)-like permease
MGGEGSGHDRRPGSAARRGLWLAAIACLLWGTVPPAGKLLSLSGHVHPLATALVRFVVAAGALCAYGVARDRRTAIRAGPADWAMFAALGATGVFGLGFLVFTAAELTTVVNTTLLLNSNPIFICALAMLIGERITPGRAGGTALGLAGCVVIVLWGAHGGPAQEPDEGAHLAGDLCGLGAGLVWAIYTVLGRSLRARYEPHHAVTAATALGSVMLLVAAIATRARLQPSVAEWAVLIYLGLLPTAAAFLFWSYGLRHVDASVIGPLQYIAPVAGTMLGCLLFGEVITAGFLAGAALVLVGIGLSTRSR